MKKIIYSTLFVLSAGFAFSQNNETINNGRIIGSFELGSKEVTSILDETTGCVRKSSPHSKGLFVPNENVELILKENKQTVEVRKPSLPEHVYANKNCNTNSTTLSSEEEAFLVQLNNAIDSVINNNITQGVERVNNPNDDFGIAHKEVIEQIYLNNPNKKFNIAWFSNQYKSGMTTLGFGSEMDGLNNSIGLFNSHNDNSNKTAVDLRYTVYSEFEATQFSIEIAELIYSRAPELTSKENTYTMLSVVEKMIAETDLIQESEQNQLLKSISIGINNLDIVELAAGPPSGHWRDCVGFAASFIGGVLSGPFGMGLGLIGMAASAPGCESWLGW